MTALSPNALETMRDAVEADRDLADEMTLTCCVERWSDALPELKLIFPTHYRELALNQDHVPLSPMYDEYARREANGSLLFVGLRRTGKLIGYYVCFIGPALHYQTCLTAHLDMFYVHPDHRTKMGGLRLFRTVERELRRRGVQRWFVGSKVHADASRLFEALDFQKVEVTYSKWLGDA